MSLMFLDRVEVTPITRDANVGSVTEELIKPYKAFVEDEDRMEFSPTGTPVRPVRFIMLPKNAVVSKGDMIKTTKLSGVVTTGSAAIRREVLEVVGRRGINISHLELKTSTRGQ